MIASTTGYKTIKVKYWCLHLKTLGVAIITTSSVYIHFSFMNFENGFVLDASKWRFHNSLLGTLRLPIKAFSYCYPFLWAKIHETVNNPPFCLYLFNPSSFMYISVIERGEVLEFLVDWAFQTLASSHRTWFDVFRRLLQNRFLFCEKKLEFVPCLR